MRVYQNLIELVGNTPILRLNNVEKTNNLTGEIYAKLEKYNPAGSVKDRAALEIIEDAERKGILKPGATIIEPTSGNTGIGLAFIARLKGYKVILTMPSSMSEERIKVLKAYGAEVVLTDAVLGMQGSLDKADEILKQTPGAIIAGQFTNPANVNAHYKTTGPEIWEDMDGNIDVFIASVGTGGTLTGTAKYLKEKNKDIKIVAVEPAESPLISKGIAGQHGIQGIGANFIPEILDRNIIDEVYTVTTDEAYQSSREVAQKEGLLVGISSGSVIAAAKHYAKNNKKVVIILPDSGERYLSTELYK